MRADPSINVPRQDVFFLPDFYVQGKETTWLWSKVTTQGGPASSWGIHFGTVPFRAAAHYLVDESYG